MGSILNEVEQSLKVTATKCYDDETGLVSIGGWRGYLSEETPILFTVLDNNSQSKWTRLVEQTSNRKTLKVKIPRSAVHHQIVTTAELLREKNSCVKESTRLRRFTVESTCTCVAITTKENCQLELSTSSCQSMSARNTKNDFPTKISLAIERISVEKAGLCLKKSARGVVRWLVTVEEVEASDRKDVFLLAVDQNTTDFEFPIEDGRKYHVEAIGLDRTGGIIFCRGSTNYKTGLHLPAAYSKNELRQLHQIAVANVGHGSAPCVWLYRNKKPEYFDDILKNDGGIMKPYLKDNSGDPRSPINSRIDGLFFMASVTSGSKPIPVSAFGKQRVLVPAEELLAKAPNLYFTDFYCMRGKNHYVTLVMTRPGSEADKFCANHLLSLNLRDRSSNPFFFYDKSSHRLHVSTKKQLIVELLFTEDLDIRGYEMKQTKIVAKGHSTQGGIPKNRNCVKCNLPKSKQISATRTRIPELMINNC